MADFGGEAGSARFLPVFQAARPLLFTEKPLYSARTQGKEWKLLIEGVNPIGAAFVTVFVLMLLIDVLVAAAPLSAFAAAWIYTPRGQKRE